MKNNKTKTAVLLGIGAALGYKLIKGEGVFNKVRFNKVHKAVENYLSSYHENAKYGEIIKTDDGWNCIVNNNGRNFLLNIHQTEDGNFLFSETDL